MQVRTDNISSAVKFEMLDWYCKFGFVLEREAWYNWWEAIPLKSNIQEQAQIGNNWLLFSYNDISYLVFFPFWMRFIIFSCTITSLILVVFLNKKWNQNTLPAWWNIISLPLDHGENCSRYMDKIYHLCLNMLI